MIASLYEPYKKWSENGSIYIISDLHFDDEDCLLMSDDWIKPERQIEIINSLVMKNDTFVCLGDVGRADYIKQIKAKRKILLLGNHDKRADYVDYFDEIYAGPLFIAEKILLSHEPVYGLPWCLNIHGHDHSNVESYKEGCKHLNLAANVCGYTPVNLGKLIKDGILSDVDSIHRMTIDKAVSKKNTYNLSIDSISDEEAIEFLDICKDETGFEEKYIPSKDVKAKIKSDKWIFSDRDKATIIWNSDKVRQTKYADLIEIMKTTSDEGLRDQISERIRYDAVALRLFDEKSRGFIYATNTDEYPGEDNIIGYFDSMKLAYEAGKTAGYSYRIEKFQVFGKGAEKIKSWLVVSPLLAKDEDKQLEEMDIPGSPVATIKYDKDGNCIDYWSCETSKEDKKYVESIGCHRFENAYVNFPNPFELGDYVRCIGTDKIGMVDISQEKWRNRVENALKEDAIYDYIDASITILYDSDKKNHDHISPIYLEKVSLDLPKSNPIVMFGHDSGNSYWIRPVKISNAGQIYLNEVEELDPEISVMAEYVDGIVLEIFKRYLDIDNEYNKRRVRFDYDPSGKSVIGFGMDMVHNFYDAEHVKKMAYNLNAVSLYLCDRQYALEKEYISENIINEINKYDAHISELDETDQYEKTRDYAKFMRELADHLMGIIDYGRDKDIIISIMAP